MDASSGEGAPLPRGERAHFLPRSRPAARLPAGSSAAPGAPPSWNCSHPTAPCEAPVHGLICKMGAMTEPPSGAAVGDKPVHERGALRSAGTQGVLHPVPNNDDGFARSKRQRHAQPNPPTAPSDRVPASHARTQELRPGGWGGHCLAQGGSRGKGQTWILTQGGFSPHPHPHPTHPSAVGRLGEGPGRAGRPRAPSGAGGVSPRPGALPLRVPPARRAAGTGWGQGGGGRAVGGGGGPPRAPPAAAFRGPLSQAAAFVRHSAA